MYSKKIIAGTLINILLIGMNNIFCSNFDNSSRAQALTFLHATEPDSSITITKDGVGKIKFGDSISIISDIYPAWTIKNDEDWGTIIYDQNNESIMIVLTYDGLVTGFDIYSSIFSFVNGIKVGTSMNEVIKVFGKQPLIVDVFEGAAEEFFDLTNYYSDQNKELKVFLFFRSDSNEELGKYLSDMPDERTYNYNTNGIVSHILIIRGK